MLLLADGGAKDMARSRGQTCLISPPDQYPNVPRAVLRFLPPRPIYTVLYLLRLVILTQHSPHAAQQCRPRSYTITIPYVVRLSASILICVDPRPLACRMDAQIRPDHKPRMA